MKYTVNGEVLARQGSMVAFRGNLQFERKGEGVGRMLRRAVTGEGLPLMSVRGQGEAWFAHPIIIPVTPRAPVYVDTDAVVGWSAGLEAALHRSQSIGSMIRGGSGEAVQLKLGGEGFVIVRPSEAVESAAAH